jgi:hypothetical protein
VQLEQFHFKTSGLPLPDFQELLKQFSFSRKKAEDSNPPKRISQTAQLRQSRISNSSLATVTDRKTIKRDDSMLRSSYYELSHGHQPRCTSRSRDKQGEHLSKDLSQRVLFPLNHGRPDRPEGQGESKANCRSKNSIFFDSVQEHSHQTSKDSETPSLGLKDVKYINLETVITEKIDKGRPPVSKKEAL